MTSAEEMLVKMLYEEREKVRNLEAHIRSLQEILKRERAEAGE